MCITMGIYITSKLAIVVPKTPKPHPQNRTQPSHDDPTLGIFPAFGPTIHGGCSDKKPTIYRGVSHYQTTIYDTVS